MGVSPDIFCSFFEQSGKICPHQILPAGFEALSARGAASAAQSSF